jgi:Arc/MetJ-type ribon-helix-helix transcriptional regulator
MPKVSADVPQELLDDVQAHVGDDAKFVSTSDAIRSALRKMLDQMDRVDERRGRAGDESEADTR